MELQITDVELLICPRCKCFSIYSEIEFNFKLN